MRSFLLKTMPLFKKKKSKLAIDLLRLHIDEQFYKSQIPGLVDFREDAATHYFQHGATKGLDPAPWFSTFGYLKAYPDVLASKKNPFLHYLQDGRAEGRILPWLEAERDTTPPPFELDGALSPCDQILRYIHWFHAERDKSFTLEETLDSGRAAIAQHLEVGETLLPDDDLALHLHMAAVRHEFDAEFVGMTYDDVTASNADLLAFYCRSGWRQFQNPREGFDLWWYWRSYLHPSLPVLDPLLHYVLIGKSLGLPTRAPQPEAALLSAADIQERDVICAKDDNWWAFPVCAYDHSLSGNDRAVFEAVRYDPTIRKTVLTRGRPVDVDGANVHVVPLISRSGQESLLRSRVIFIKHSPRVNVEFPLSHEHHLFIGLWHGIPFKRIGTASLDARGHRGELLEQHSKLACVISASPIDRLAMMAGFQPLSFDEVWMTGLPRHDLIVSPFDNLPEDMQREEKDLRDALGNRRLVLYCPTFRRNIQSPGYHFKDLEIARLARWLDNNNAVLGIREHMADRRHSYASQLAGNQFMPLPGQIFANIEVLYRVSRCLVTDYSSCFFDYMLTGKASISFAYDFEQYQAQERGTFYDLETAFPGPVCRDVNQLIDALTQASARDFANCDPQFALKRSLFLAFNDQQNASRVVERVKRLLSEKSAFKPDEIS